MMLIRGVNTANYSLALFEALELTENWIRSTLRIACETAEVEAAFISTYYVATHLEPCYLLLLLLLLKLLTYLIHYLQ